MNDRPTARRCLEVASIAAAALAVASLGVACFAEQACTLVGCTSILSFDAPWAESAEPFGVEIDAPGLVGAFDCVPDTEAADGTFVVDASSLAGDFALDTEPSFSAHCNRGTAGFGFFPRVRGATMPSEVAVTVTTADDARSQTFSEIDYNVSQPNGEACEPTCLSALLLVE